MSTKGRIILEQYQQDGSHQCMASGACPCRYPGEGRVADQGFTNPRWVPGELLVFNNRSNSSSRSEESYESWISDAQLGFVFDVAGQRKFCVLLNRVTLP